MKLCKDCKFIKVRHHWNDVCTHKITHPVSGIVMDDHFKDCEWVRTCGPCGWDAKWFEARELIEHG